MVTRIEVMRLEPKIKPNSFVASSYAIDLQNKATTTTFLNLFLYKWRKMITVYFITIWVP